MSFYNVSDCWVIICGHFEGFYDLEADFGRSVTTDFKSAIFGLSTASVSSVSAFDS